MQPSSRSAQITCAISPTSVTVSGTGATATMTISTTAPHVLPGTSASVRPHGLGWWATGGSVLFAGIFLVGVPSRRRRIAGLGLMLLVFFAAGAGCGGSSSSGSPKNAGTAAGSYSITVTATSTSPALSHTANVSVTVQ